ncbi:MAG: tetratricopeptide repeat protein [Thermoanaerobacteraceae bacterium]|nr:tetratricopeptide repeat protein [Thermoanaerobacteraceae bacterium]
MNLSEKLKTFLSNESVRNKKEHIKTRFYPSVSDIVGGTTVTTPFGEHLLVEKTYPGSHIHGNIQLDLVCNISGEIIKLIAKSSAYESFDFARAVFIDTETTGLAGGSGTLAFLIGVGFFQGNDFKILQYFISDYDKETAALYSLSKLLEKFNGIVTFNGKSYDIPLLEARYMLSRMESPFKKPFHLDLLASARRLYKERLESVSLSSLETNLLCFKRDGDIPGFEIPSVYFRFLKDNNPHPLKPIFYHNRMDILSMVTLTNSMACAFKEHLDSTTCVNQDYYCLGRVFEDMGMIEQSIKCYEKALHVMEVKDKSYTQLSLLYKRLGQWQEAERLWTAMVKSNIRPVFALVELAKYYEHKLKDYDRAAEATQKALEKVYTRNALVGYTLKEEIFELKKRLERIKCKQNKHETSIIKNHGYPQQRAFINLDQ